MAKVAYEYPDRTFARLNPREIRALAQPAIEAYAHGEQDYVRSRKYVERVLKTSKGRRSGLGDLLDKASLSDVNLVKFADAFTPKAVTFKEQPFELRAGGRSHWYVDSRHGLSGASEIGMASMIMIAQANRLRIEREIVAGMGIAGLALSNTIALNEYPKDVQRVEGNDKSSPDQRYGYGLHGADVNRSKVWVVDDIATTGDSLRTLIEMVRDNGGTVEHASVLTDRSSGKAEQAMAEMGVAFHSAFVFDESTGAIKPSGQLVELAA